MYFIFYKTNDVFMAEEKLKSKSIQVDVVPTPVQDKAYCGVCVQLNDADINKAKNELVSMEYKTVE